MPEAQSNSDQGSAREGFGPDACDQDRVDAPTRDRLQRLYGSVDLLADRSRATADGQYEDVKGIEVIIGDLREEVDRLRTILDGCDDEAIERVALVLFARSFIPMQTVDAVRHTWEHAPDSTTEAVRLAALEILRAAGELSGSFDEERPTDKCPACKGEGGAFHEHPSTLSPWIECKVCGGSGASRETSLPEETE